MEEGPDKNASQKSLMEKEEKLSSSLDDAVAAELSRQSYFRDNSIDMAAALVNRRVSMREDLSPLDTSLVRGIRSPMKKRREEGFVDSLSLETLVTPPTKKRKDAFTSPQLVDPNTTLSEETVILGDSCMFSGFQTGLGESVRVSLSLAAGERRSLGSLFVEEKSREKEPSVRTGEYALSLAIDGKKVSLIKRVRARFVESLSLANGKCTKEEKHQIRNVFKWTWLSRYMEIDIVLQDMVAAKSQEARVEAIVVPRALEIWKKDPLSVLRRIAEKDEAPGVYMKVLVVEKNIPFLRVTDGLYSVKIKADRALEAVANKIKVGSILKIFGARPLIPSPVPIREVDARDMPLLEVCYNGVQLSFSGNLGYQKESTFLRSLYSIERRGGMVGAVEVWVTKVLETKYLMDLNGSKNVIEEARFRDSLERIRKSIEKMCLPKAEERDILARIRVKKFTKIEAQDLRDKRAPRPLVLITIWNPPEDISLKEGAFRFIYLVTKRHPYEENALSLSTIPQSLIIPIQEKSQPSVLE
jgi:BRCA2, oligonucleotide/oligosaccharide-binding, domain 1